MPGKHCSLVKQESSLLLKPDYTNRVSVIWENGMLYYQRQGKGPEVVLVHGFLGSSSNGIIDTSTDTG
ncbi:MAG: hypothetical protein GY927_16635 [bacterium]|nr:hypothetical protein [bacterium]